jgi:hypothetical protein
MSDQKEKESKKSRSHSEGRMRSKRSTPFVGPF